MAPELRKRKAVVVESKDNTNGTKAAAKSTAKGKRKAPVAAEDASPVSLKKQKPTKKAATESKSVEKPVEKPVKTVKTAKSKKKTAEEAEPEEAEPAEAEVEETPQDDTVLAVSDESDTDGEENDKVQKLATQLDPEDEDGQKGDALFKPGQDVGKIPKISKQAGKKAGGEEPGVIYIGRIPHGFYEHEMRQYFSQFGPITKLRLSRNKKTGASKHFAFVEFAEASTAAIVVKTMDSYLLFGHILKCRVIPKEQVHDDLFKGANRRFKKVPWNKMAGRQLAKPLTEAAWDKKSEKEKARREKKASKLQALGYDFEAPELKKAPAAPATPAIENGEKEPKAIEAAPAEGADTDKGTVAAAESEEPTTQAAETTTKPKATKATKAKTAKGAKAKKAKA